MALGMGIIQMKTGLTVNKIMDIERGGFGVEFWVLAWNNAYVLLLLENHVELVGYGLGSMFGELLPIHVLMRARRGTNRNNN
jgi:hypothetical protein